MCAPPDASQKYRLLTTDSSPSQAASLEAASGGFEAVPGPQRHRSRELRRRWLRFRLQFEPRAISSGRLTGRC
jgi:hypothetical protein